MSDSVRVIQESQVLLCRQAARHAFEATHLGVLGKPLPRADGDLWWPGTEPRQVEVTPAPAPLSRQADMAHRSGWGR